MVNRFRVSMLLALVLCLTGCTNNNQTVESSPPSTSGASLSRNEESPQDKSPQESAPIIIDVRSREEWDAGHLEQAIFIPHEEIPEKIAGVTEDKSAKLVLY
jgi:phage shock protein E